MIGIRHCVIGVLAPMLLLSGAKATARHDPLSETEIDELRDSAQDPDTRLKLYLKFAQARLDSIPKIKADAKSTDHGRQIHDRLQEFIDVFDELNENIETFASRREDIRKTLKSILETDRAFQATLQSLRDTPGDKDDFKLYDFVLTDATEDVASGAFDHSEALAAQEVAAKQKKLLKPQPPGRPPSKPQ